MPQTVSEYLRDLELDLIELSSAERDDVLDEVYQLVLEMRKAGLRERDIIKRLGPTKKVAKEYLRKYGKGGILNRITERLTPAPAVRKTHGARVKEYYLRFYKSGKYKVNQQELSRYGTWEIAEADIFLLRSDWTELEIVRDLENRFGLTTSEYELVNPRTKESF
ncbi:MAG: DUF1700 domain-containing protein [Solobacterium sp.]|nr:DUF1700 domain-containing protein [Erysipelotrichaceae bacterium]MBQ9032515.1 DUF1700 domain-containing protein [Parasporobacterium sp.]MBQ9153384.1 DUF1700 domain-containing protein [Solobacterium sp.]